MKTDELLDQVTPLQLGEAHESMCNVLDGKGRRICSVTTPPLHWDAVELATLFLRAVNSFEAARELIQNLEFDATDHCPWCHRHQRDGHVPGKCQVAAVLKQMDGEA